MNEEIENRICKHLTMCLKNKDNYLIKNDLMYFYHVLLKDFNYSVEKYDDLEIIEQIVIAVKKDLKNLRKIIPSKIYTFDMD